MVKQMSCSLRSFSLGFLVVLSFVQLTCSRQAKHTSAQSTSVPAQNESFDTLSVLKRLTLSRDDSLVLHFERSDTLERYLDIDDRSILHVSGDSLIYAVRTVTNQFLAESQVSKFFSAVILYSRTTSQAEIGKIHQDSIEVFCASLSSYAPAVRFMDINYDGYQDILLSFTTNTSDRVGYNYFYVFHPSTCKFEVDIALYSLFHELEIYVDTDQRCISEGGRIGLNGYGGSEYRWNGKTYEQFAQISTEQNNDGTALIETRTELLGGKWVTVSSDTTWTR